MKDRLTTRDYFIAIRDKLTSNLLSVKVWFFLFPFIISTIYLSLNLNLHFDIIIKILKMSLENQEYTTIVELFKNAKDLFIAWCTFTVSLGGTIVVVREKFKIDKLYSYIQTNQEEKVKEMDV